MIQIKWFVLNIYVVLDLVAALFWGAFNVFGFERDIHFCQISTFVCKGCKWAFLYVGHSNFWSRLQLADVRCAHYRLRLMKKYFVKNYLYATYIMLTMHNDIWGISFNYISHLAHALCVLRAFLYIYIYIYISKGQSFSFIIILGWCNFLNSIGISKWNIWHSNPLSRFNYQYIYIYKSHFCVWLVYLFIDFYVRLHHKSMSNKA